jgi:serralysin
LPDKPIISDQDYVSQLTRLGRWYAPQSVIGFAFLEQQPAWAPIPNFAPFDANQRAATLRAFGLVSEVANLTFAQVPANGQEPGVGNSRITFHAGSVNSQYSGATLPYFAGDTDQIHAAAINLNLQGIAYRVQTGGYFDWTFYVILHEILHAVGLSHPGSYNGPGYYYEDHADFAQDTRQYSVMSYWDAAKNGADHIQGDTQFVASTPLLYDILSLQQLYGANMGTRTGDTVYGFNSNTGQTPFNFAFNPGPVIAIWDAGGNDTIDLSGYATASRIDLNQGAYSDAGGMTGNVAIAFGALIENAVGGSGADVVIGNAAANRIYLQAGGDDEARGGGGNDGVYFGRAYTSADTVFGGDGIDSVALQGRYAALTLGALHDVEVLLLLPGDDHRFGDLSNDPTTYAIATTDANVAAGALLKFIATELRPGGENLLLDGSAETDGAIHVYAGRSIDSLTGGAGRDGFLFGADGNLDGADRIDGGGGTDSVALRGDYIGARAILFQEASLTGIEVLVLLSGRTNEFGGFIVADGFDYDVTMADGNLAAGLRMDVIGSTLGAGETIRFDGRAELDGSFRIIAGNGDDTLFGSAGGDLIFGGGGADNMDGGDGADVYLYRSSAESSAAASDTILLGAGDAIDLSQVDADAGADGDQAFAWLGDAAFGGVAGELRAVAQEGGGWRIEGDVDGDGLADLVILATGPAPLETMFLL